MGQVESNLIDNLTVSSGYLKEKVMFCTISVKPRSINESITINSKSNINTDLIPKYDKQLSKIPFKGYADSPNKPILKQMKLKSCKKLPTNDIKSILKKTVMSSSKKLKNFTDSFFKSFNTNENQNQKNEYKKGNIGKLTYDIDIKLKKTKSNPDIEYIDEFIDNEDNKINKIEIGAKAEDSDNEIPIKEDYFENSDLKNIVKIPNESNFKSSFKTSHDSYKESDKFFMFTILEDAGKPGVSDYIYRNFDENVRYNYEYNQIIKKDFNPHSFLTSCFLRMDYLISKEEDEEFSIKNSIKESEDNLYATDLELNNENIKEVEMIYDILNNKDKNWIYPYDSGCYILSCLIIEDKHLVADKLNVKLDEDFEFINTIPKYSDLSDTINFDHNFDSKTESLRTVNDDQKLTTMNSNKNKNDSKKFTLFISNLGINEIYLKYNSDINNSKELKNMTNLDKSNYKIDANSNLNYIYSDKFNPHNCRNILEENRVYMAGGFVQDYKVNNILEGTRCLGYFDFKKNINITIDKQIVTAIPNIYKISLDSDLEFILLASSSLLKLIDYQELINYIMNKIKWYINRKNESKTSTQSLVNIKNNKKSSKNIKNLEMDLDNSDGSTVFSKIINNKDHENFKKYLETICKEIFEITASETFNNNFNDFNDQDKDSNNSGNFNQNKENIADMTKSIRESITKKRMSKDDKISLYNNCVLTIIFINFNINV